MQGQTVLNLVLRLCKTLEAEGVVYCHWKSNVALDRSASGDNDLDLLVSRADVQRFTEILCRLGFKSARVPPEREVPGILDYYGYDRDTGKLVHVHAHYQLVLGHDMTKNYHLPIERPFLASVVQSDLFKVPAPEFEFVVFVLRMIIKHLTWDAVLAGQGILSAAERQELAYLQTRVSQIQVCDLLKQHLPTIDATLFDQCLQSLQPHCPMGTRLRVGQQLQSKLQAHARRPQISDTRLKLWRLVKAGIRRYFFRRPSRKRMASGGAVIAIVGADGAGKSTAVDEVYVWLAKNFDTRQVHMGKPLQSWSTVAVRGASKVTSWLGALLKRNWSVDFGADARAPAFLKYLWLMRRVCIGRDRYRAYVQARRFATNGGLVICDRYPLPEVKRMDGPQSYQTIMAGQANRLIEFLVQVETRYYQHIMLPELLIVLRVDPEIAVQRRPDQDAAFVRARAQEIWELDWRQTPAHVMDASRSAVEVLAAIKSTLWSEL